MPPLRVLICDDEPLALDRLAALIGQCAGAELAGSVLGGRELIDEVQKSAPDLILLDIEMPHVDGFDVIEALSRLSWPPHAGPPLVVFVTAHPEFAVDAFESGALDFISKPVRLSRLERALSRAAEAAEQREARRRLAELTQQLDELKRMRREADEDRFVWVRRGTERLRVDMLSVDWIAAEGEYVRFHCGGDSFLERGSISETLARFEPYGFVRIHRSAIVNPARIEGIDTGKWGGLKVRLRSGALIPVGKTYRPAVRALVRQPR
jgi:two-component system, LytTR family, response regulator